MRKLVLSLAGVAVVAALALFGLSFARDEPPQRERSQAPAAAAATPTPPPERRAISTYPAPGAKTASPETQLSFRGAPLEELGEIVVTGARSGRHGGRLRAHSDGSGASFLPSKPFAQGETVTVATDLDLTGADDGDYSIQIARQAKWPGMRRGESPEKGRGAVHRYATRPDLIIPDVTIHTARDGRAPGYVFLAPKGGRGHEGPMIIDDEGRVVWFKRMPANRVAVDFRAQTYRGKPVITWWQGGLIVGDGRGVGQIYDERYRRVKTVRAGNGYSMDLHEFVITPQDTALVIAFDRVKQDLRPLGGPREGVVIAGIVQEIDIKTGLVLFEWHTMDGISLEEGKAPLPKKDGGQYDYVHLNSVELDADGNFLVSARNSWGAYKLDRATATVAWRFNGTKPSFKMGEGTTTAWQHDARWLDDGNLLLFDNGSSPQVHKTSRAITVSIDEQAKTATLVRALEHPKKLLSSTQGGAQPLPNGNTFVGWGSQRYFSEYDAGGKLVFDGELARGNDNYRAYRMEWTGRPAERPRAVATRSGGRVTARVSWNGATEVAKWQLLAGGEPVGEAEADDFETAVSGWTGARAVTLRALDADGETLATSAPVRPR